MGVPSSPFPLLSSLCVVCMAPGMRKRGIVYFSVEAENDPSGRERRLHKRSRQDLSARREADKEAQRTNSISSSRQSFVIVAGDLPAGCTVLELKSRLEMFGSVSRVRIDGDLKLGYVTFRTRDSAELAVSTSQNPLYPISVRNKQVQVSWANDPLPLWKVGVTLSTNKEGSTSKLLRAEVPLSRHGKTTKKVGDSSITSQKDLHSLYKGRAVVAYDDLL